MWLLHPLQASRFYILLKAGSAAGRSRFFVNCR
jgi:hypothetical protein